MSNGCVYEDIIVIGYGQIVNGCLGELKRLKSKYNYSLHYIEYEKTDLSVSIDFCEKEGIEYSQIFDKSEVKEYFLNITKQTLIISAGNFYIFPEEVVKKKELTIINFHSALLPKYPGRNAQSWAIFNDEKEAGATWHFVTEELDAGKYIIQKACPILEDTKAYELTGRIMDEAYNGFLEIVEGVLLDKYDKIQTVPTDKNRRIYKGKDIPGEAHFTLEDDPKYIYKVLRATDYGKSDIFPPVCTELDEKTVRISSYKKIIDEEIKSVVIDEKTIYIPYDEQYVLRLKYKSME